MRVRSHSRGEPFNLTLNFYSPVETQPGKKYKLSLYSLINCAKVECAQANDKLTVYIKEGNDGVLKEVLTISGRSLDEKWSKDTISIVATKDKLFVIN